VLFEMSWSNQRNWQKWNLNSLVRVKTTSILFFAEVFNATLEECKNDANHVLWSCLSYDASTLGCEVCFLNQRR
jgi:hypothetical protein